MKKILFGILTFLGIGLSFCSAQGFIDEEEDPIQNEESTFYSDVENYLKSNSIASGTFVSECPSSSCSSYYFTTLVDRGFESNGYSFYNYCALIDSDVPNFSIGSNGIVLRITSSLSPNANIPGPFMYSSSLTSTGNVFLHILCNTGRRRYLTIGSRSSTDSFKYYVFDFSTLLNFNTCPEPEPSTIDVLYNNENSSSTITCNGDNSITIDGLSTITATNTRTPYFNINYRDQDNQLLTESYSKDILYLSGGLYKKTYTGNNDRVLSVLNVKQDSNFSGYLPVFDITFTGDALTDTGNIFNNFAQNSLKMTLSNIPSYIQYVIIFGIFLFILGFIRKFKRR